MTLATLLGGRSTVGYWGITTAERNKPYKVTHRYHGAIDGSGAARSILGEEGLGLGWLTGAGESLQSQLKPHIIPEHSEFQPQKFSGPVCDSKEPVIRRGKPRKRHT